MGSSVPSKPSCFNAAIPPGCSSSPTIRFGSDRSRSRRRTSRPCFARATARALPMIPAPMMATSKERLEGGGGGRFRSSGVEVMLNVAEETKTGGNGGVWYSGGLGELKSVTVKGAELSWRGM